MGPSANKARMAPLLVLASASPRRRELLGQLAVPFDVLPSDVPEKPLSGEPPATFAQRVAQAKAAEVSSQRPLQWILAADTVVTIDGVILGKPKDRASACRMLNRLSARTHRVLTAVALAAPGGRLVDGCVSETAVTMRAITDAEIARYVDTGEPFDKAGGYGIQGGASPFIERSDGSYTNVVGLPLDEVRTMLERHGLLPRHASAAPA